MKRWLVFFLLFGFLSACGGGDTSPLTVSNAWVRPSPTMTGAGAAYFTVTNNTNSDDRLLSVSSDSAASLELHETKEVNGMMGMSPLPDGIVVPANGRLELAPGGIHVMLMGLSSTVTVGQEVSLTLHFQNAGDLIVTALVSEER